LVQHFSLHRIWHEPDGLQAIDIIQERHIFNEHFGSTYTPCASL
jgi:hypothetical protein